VNALDHLALENVVEVWDLAATTYSLLSTIEGDDEFRDALMFDLGTIIDLYAAEITRRGVLTRQVAAMVAARSH
jgi:hypothetical protein